MNVELATMTADDYDAVLDLWRSTENVGLSSADTRESIHAYLERNPDLSLVARSGGRVIGALLAGHDGRRGYLHHLAVAPEYRRQGIGTALVDASLARLAAAGIGKCHIFLFHQNDDGQAFWASAGWSLRTDLKVMSRSIAEGARQP
jgi:ribosomal protein S18 acetylase RimI-like enzyme